jgi:hypothetical protein
VKNVAVNYCKMNVYIPSYRGDSRAVFVVGPVMGNRSVLAEVYRSMIM